MFLGDRSFEFEELLCGESLWGITVVERGGGLRRAISLFGEEIDWLETVFQKVSRKRTGHGFLDRYSEGTRSVACS